MDSSTCEFTEVARRDLDETLQYISATLFNPTAARTFFNGLEEKIAEISRFPESCPRVENDFLIRTDIRKAIVGNYIMYYGFDKERRKVCVLRIVYGRRNLDEILRSLH